MSETGIYIYSYRIKVKAAKAEKFPPRAAGDIHRVSG
jgi:hypothetical protein